MDEINQYPQLNSFEEFILFQKYQNGDLIAKQYLINCNLRLVLWCVNKHYKKYNCWNYMDLVQEGNIGLIKAIENYDIKRGEFSTYAVHYINGYIKKSFFKNNKFSISNRQYWHLVAYQNLINKYHDEQLEIPNDQTICQLLGISLNQLCDIKEVVNYEEISLNELIEKEKIDDGLIVDFDFSTYSEQELLAGLQRILSPFLYYIFYCYYISDSKTSYSSIADCLGVRFQYIGYSFNKLLDKLKQVLVIEHDHFEMVLEKIRQEEKNLINRVRTKPIMPENIMMYIYLKPCLNEIEIRLLKLTFFDRYDYSPSQAADFLQLSFEEYQSVYANLVSKMNLTLEDQEHFQTFCQKMLAKYKTNIFKIDLDADYSFIDPLHFQTMNSIINQGRFRIK